MHIYITHIIYIYIYMYIVSGAAKPWPGAASTHSWATATPKGESNPKECAADTYIIYNIYIYIYIYIYVFACP